LCPNDLPLGHNHTGHALGSYFAVASDSGVASANRFGASLVFTA
jgi:hypothetical protein